MTQPPPPDPSWRQHDYQPPRWPPPAHASPEKKKPFWRSKKGAFVLLVGALFLAIVMTPKSQPAAPKSAPSSTWTGAPVTAVPAQTEQANEETAGSVVVYEVTGKGSASVTYMKEGFSQEQQTSAKLPYRKQLQFKDKIGSFAPISLVAQHVSGGGDLTCRVTVDGQVVAENTSSGQYAVVTCSGNG